ncbi:hypothetical protein JOF53_007516 [Crossiella equi]|uniref:Uncharacterized protein n=1 Tax=Crossiella equi TaxID=130796 RepID=A0ABS5AQZ5_9PSEU|nr:hypothetical protein [Crossiella equi]MBP2478644.1 hypothetical protein [Crossiella equi]
MRRSALAAFAAALLLTSAPPDALAGAPLAATPAAADYGDYSQLFQRSAGQYFADGRVAGQWAWKPLSATESEVAWGDPRSWPPSGGEHFIRDGDWLLLNGYADHQHGTFNTQRVTAEEIGDADCANRQPLPSNGGRQHYARWTIPAQPYCLVATGVITVGANGAKVNFRHEQIWYPPAPCTNSYLGARTCIRQHERWFDDKGTPFSLALERDQYLAQDIGMAFRIHHTYSRGWAPGRPPWNAELRYHWRW